MIFSSQPKPHSELKTITLVGMFRAGKNEKTVEIALDNTGIWIPISVSLVESVKESGTITINGIAYKVLEMVINSPSENSEWFDLPFVCTPKRGIIISE
jgi:nitric oxide synthase oxygenase domain/subunit